MLKTVISVSYRNIFRKDSKAHIFVLMGAVIVL